ncbi:MAG: TetR/AcrR family transcriptional regulator [Pseudomonadota bacterium]
MKSKRLAAPPAHQVKKLTKGEKTKERIRQGVRNLLATRDFADISIEDVVDETGLPVGSIYFHFKNKDGLMTDIAEQGLYDFYNYFTDIEDEDLFGAAFLVCWRSVQQYVNRRGNTQLTHWYLTHNLDNLDTLWKPLRSDIIHRYAEIVAKSVKHKNITDEDLMLAELLFLGTEYMLATQSRSQSPKGKIRGDDPLNLAIHLATMWYRSVLGPEVPLPRNKSKTIKRILDNTKLLKRPIELPPA